MLKSSRAKIFHLSLQLFACRALTSGFLWHVTSQKKKQIRCNLPVAYQDSAFVWFKKTSAILPLGEMAVHRGQL